MLKKVYMFNKARNKFAWDEKLEIKMFQEEIKEFFDAESVAERIDAYVDCEYVIQGTEMKAIYNDEPNPNVKLWNRAENLMRSIIADELDGLSFDIVVERARDIVCASNELKGKELVEGKVSKKAFTVNATEQIASMVLVLKQEKKEGK
ncbi:MAG: hypothetical protein DRG78_02850 [Epsilonproteobacteria bacterium]|nr:MAG: hypothetical protein DRG78_02850 [Campylobacterota bacterium]